MPRPAEIRFASPTLPVAEAVAAVLLDDAPRLGHAADLTDLLVIAPTRTAGRKLREALAREAKACGLAGVLTPKIFTPDAALHAFGAPVSTASSEAASMAMSAALASFSPEELPDLFPEPPQPWSVGALRTAAQALLKVRRTLGEAADTPDFAAVAPRADNPEPERWADLAKVETRYRETLAKLGLTDADDARAALVRTPVSPAGIRRVVLAAFPDPSPALRRLLENTGLPVHIITVGEETERDRFDAWGAPLPEPWTKEPILWENFDRQLRTPDSPATLHAELAELFSRHRATGRTSAVIAADPSLSRPLERALLDTGALANAAEGTPLDTHPHAVILRDWADFLRDSSWESLGRLLRRPDFAKVILKTIKPQQNTEDDVKSSDSSPPHSVTACGESQNQFALLRAWDRTEEKLLPKDLPDFAVRDEADKARRLVDAVVREAHAMRRAFLATPFDAAVSGFLIRLGQTGHALDEPFSETVSASAKELTGLLANFPGHDASEALALIWKKLSSARHHPESPAESVPVRGWMELLWEDSPHLVVAGLNEGAVPETIAADAFLPGAFRDKLGLTGDAARLARDAHLLSCALRLRAAGRGRLDAFAPKTDAKGDPLRPSRLLFIGAGDALPERVERLFAEAGDAPPEPSRTRGWKLKPRVSGERLRAVAAGIAPTAFGDHLDCPFRFYLKRVLRAEATEPDRAEPDAAAFGNLVHGVLAGFANDATERDLTDEGLIREALDRRVERELRAAYGEKPPLAALVQANAARARLHGFARTQAAHREAGWRIRHTEHAFELRLDVRDGAPFLVKGRFDRIDTHEDGRLLIIDYKTSDAGKGPVDSHLKRRRDNGYRRPDHAYTANALNAKGEPEERRWTNLQLPLYHEAALASGMAAFNAIGTAYWLLPAAASEVALSVWSGYTRELHADALACAAGVAREIRARRFGPANPAPEYDDFALLLGDDPDDAVDWDNFNAELARA